MKYIFLRKSNDILIHDIWRWKVVKNPAFSQYLHNLKGDSLKTNQSINQQSITANYFDER